MSVYATIMTIPEITHLSAIGAPPPEHGNNITAAKTGGHRRASSTRRAGTRAGFVADPLPTTVTLTSPRRVEPAYGTVRGGPSSRS